MELWSYTDKMRDWYYFLENGKILGVSTSDMGESYYLVYTMEFTGEETGFISFNYIDENRNGSLDEEDTYKFRIKCTKEKWLEETEEYLYRDKNGKLQIRNAVEWIKYDPNGELINRG